MKDLLISHPRIIPGAHDPRRVVRAVDGTHVDQSSSSLAFAAFLEDCSRQMSASVELISTGARTGIEPRAGGAPNSAFSKTTRN